MRGSITVLGFIIGIFGCSSLWAADPSMTAPLQMLTDPDMSVDAHRVDFFDHPLVGNTNFTPDGKQIKLPGDQILSVQDVIPYMGTRQYAQNCKEFAATVYDPAKSLFSLLFDYFVPKVIGIPDFINFDPDVLYAATLDNCNKMTKNDQVALFVSTPIPWQVVADVRNAAKSSTQVVFSGQAVDPYVQFPIGSTGFAGAVIGGGKGADVWNDGIVTASRNQVALPLAFANSQLAGSTLSLYRFVPDKGGNQKKVLKLASNGLSFLDKPFANGQNPCVKESKDPQGKVIYDLKNYSELIALGCLGESLSVGVATPHLFTNLNPVLEEQNKSKDLVIINRDWMGNKKGYITIYRRTKNIPTDSSFLPDIWQFERALTNSSTGIPEPYDITVLHDTTPSTATDSVAMTSNVSQVLPGFKSKGYQLYIYKDGLQSNGKPEVFTIFAGLVSAETPQTPANQIHGEYGPYRIYSNDLNADGCADILLTRAKITPDQNDPKKAVITMAPYFEQYIRIKNPNGSCGGFSQTPNRYAIPALDPQKLPQISSLAIADFDKDGTLDVMAADFNTYLNSKTNTNENYVYFLKGVAGGLFQIDPNVSNLVKYPVNTISQALDSTIGPIDIKADAFANLVVAINTPIAFIPVPFVPVPIPVNIPNYCDNGGVFPETACDCVRDMDGDKIPELNLFGGALAEVEIQDCSGNKLTIPLNNTPVTLTDCTTGGTMTKTGRAWLLEWASFKDKDTGAKLKCDNCADAFAKDVCTKPEVPGKPNCYNPSQVDSDKDGYGDICDTAPLDNAQSNLLPMKPLPLADANPIIREDRVVDLNAGTIAYVDELQPAFAPINFGQNMPEVTVLLNKAVVGDTPPPPQVCPNGDLDCICQQNPGLQICKCKLDPKAIGCSVDPTQQASCSVDVCRDNLTTPFPQACDYIRPYNDEIRKITGLPIDLLVPPEGAQYHISCTLPNAPALDLGDGHSYIQVFKTGQVPRNYFNDSLKPIASENILESPVLLNPISQQLSANLAVDLTKLPQPNFSYSSLDAVVPNAVINQAPGISQIDNVLQVETFMVNVNTGLSASANGAGNNAAPQTQKVPLVDLKGYTSPTGCMWQNSSCPNPMAPPPSANDVVEAIRAMVTQYEAANKPITQDVLVDAIKTMNIGSEFMHQQFIIPGAQGSIVVPQQGVLAYSAEGGASCGCSFYSQPTLHNLVVPLLLALANLVTILILRRRMVKKH